MLFVMMINILSVALLMIRNSRKILKGQRAIFMNLLVVIRGIGFLLLLLISLNMTVQTSKNFIRTLHNGLEIMEKSMALRLIFFLFQNYIVTV